MSMRALDGKVPLVRDDPQTWALVASDERRDIRETVVEGFGITYTWFRIKSRLPLGNHYHKDKTEVFCLKNGSGKFYLQPLAFVNGRMVANGTWIVIDMVIGTDLTIAPFTAHMVILEPGSEMVCLSTKPFDQADMIPWKLA